MLYRPSSIKINKTQPKKQVTPSMWVNVFLEPVDDSSHFFFTKTGTHHDEEHTRPRVLIMLPSRNYCSLALLVTCRHLVDAFVWPVLHFWEVLSRSVRLLCTRQKKKQVFCSAYTDCAHRMAHSAHYQPRCSSSMETSFTSALFAWITHSATGIAVIVKES